MSEAARVKELIVERLKNTLQAQTTAGFAAELVEHIELGDVALEGVELDPKDEESTVSPHDQIDVVSCRT